MTSLSPFLVNHSGASTAPLGRRIDRSTLVVAAARASGPRHAPSIQQRGGRRPNVNSISHRATYQAIIETAAEMVEDDQGKPGVGGAG